MRETLHIKVFGSSESTKPLLERMIPLDDSLKVNYDALFVSLRFLFSKNCVVTFEFY